MVFDNFPLINLDEYRRVGHYDASFTDGTKPAWLTEFTSGGATISYSTDRSGYAQINTGTTAVNDSGALRFPVRLTPADYDVIVIRTEVEGVHSSALVQNRTNISGQTSGGSINLMRDYDYLNFAGTTVDLPLKNWDDGPIESHIVWDLERDRAWALVGGLASQIRSPVGQEPNDEYLVNVFYFQTRDIAADRIGRLFSAEISLYNR